jgi:CheY-like chemotaxis protein
MVLILVVDDSDSALTVVETMLAGAGHQVITSRSARHALTILEDHAVDLIITDIYMPDEDGLELMRDARRVAPNTPVIAMSGMTGKRDMLRVARGLGARCVLYKPFSRQELLTAVSQAFDSSPAD